MMFPITVAPTLAKPKVIAMISMFSRAGKLLAAYSKLKKVLTHVNDKSV
jgi:hypothetical protein